MALARIALRSQIGTPLISKNSLHKVDLADCRNANGHAYQSPNRRMAATIEAAMAICALSSAFKKTT
jgi:hypothetical protein